MKQIINGKRVINWHRPLGKDELSQRWRRQKDAVLPEDLDPVANGLNEAMEGGHPCECNCEICTGYDYNPASRIDLARNEIKNRISQIGTNKLGELIPSALLEAFSTTLPEVAISSEDSPLRADRIPAEKIIEALVQYGTLFDHREAVNAMFPEPVSRLLDEEESWSLLKEIQAEAEKRSVDTVADILLLSSFWIRELADWADPRSDFKTRIRSLIKHLFVEFPVPDFFYNNWYRGVKSSNAKWLRWFILWTRGASLSKAGKTFDWHLPKRFLHLLSQASDDLCFDEACMYAEIRRIGGSIELFKNIKQNDVYMFDPTWSSESYTNYRVFERSTLGWLIRHEDILTMREAELIMDWAKHRSIESYRWGQDNFSMKGRSPVRALAEAIAFREQIFFPRNSSYTHQLKRWKAKGWDWEWQDELQQKWTITELFKSIQLLEEGQAMHHCVGGYSSYCELGKSAIFSLQCEGKRRVTIDLSPVSGKLSEARGYNNRKVNKKERSIIDRWISKVVRPKRKSEDHAVYA